MEVQSLNIWQSIIFLGGAQGAFLAVVFYNSKRYQKVSNKFLALLLLSCAVLNFSTAAFDINLHDSYPVINYLPLNWTIVIPFALYFFVQYLVDPSYKFARVGYLLLLPVILYFLYGIYMFIHFLLHAEMLQDTAHVHRLIDHLFEGLGVLLLFSVLIMVFRKLHFFKKSLNSQYSNLESKSLDWLRDTLICVTILAILWLMDYVNHSFSVVPMRSLMYPILIGITLVLYWLGYTMFLRKDLFEVQEPLQPDKENDARSITLSARTDAHYSRLLKVMSDEHLYRDPHLSMGELAEKTGLSNGYLSQIINHKEKKNFFEFVNAYRIDEVKKNLGDPKYAHFSLLGIGQESGFNSKSTFNAVFKKMTGKTPSEYRKMITGHMAATD